MSTTNTRHLHEIAREIRRDWQKPYFGAVPYIDALGRLSSITDRYIAEDGQAIVVGFLANAGQWRGETARRVKAELGAMAGLKR